MTAPPGRIGVVGAGTMGAGIAQLGCLAGIETLLHDPFEEALGKGIENVKRGLTRGAERGRWEREEATAAEERLRPAAALDELRECELVVEAAPERLELKHELFGRLSELCARDTVLASNTSSIAIAAIAGAVEGRERVLGMHFFNPPPLMPLLELVATDDTGEAALERASATGEAMGRHVIVAADGPGFLVNRCGRPFGGEGMRLLEERVVTPAQLDRICRLGAGFRMGPCELADLVGIDVGLAVARSFDEQSFGEPRWKPSRLQARMVNAGRLGRKAGRGWYEYGENGHRDQDPEPLPIGGGHGRRVAIDGVGTLALELRERAGRAGFDARAPADFGPEPPELVVDASVPAPVSDLGIAPGGPPLAVACADTSLARRDVPGACGFHLLPPLADCKLVELTRLPTTDVATAEATERFFTALGFHPEWVGDAPGLVLGRIVCQLVNEAAFALGEGVGSAEDINAGLRLGLSHPHGPLEWGATIGLDHVLATIDGIWSERHEERYRAAPLLRSAVATGAGLA